MDSSRRSGTRWRACRALAPLLVTLAGCVPAVPRDVFTASEARRLLVDDVEPPPDDQPEWTIVRFPDVWGPAVRRRTLAGWYRMAVVLPERPRELWAVYLPRVSQTAAVWVNGVQVGGDAEPDRLPRDWIRPHLFTIPRELLGPGPNHVDVRLRTHLGAPGYLRGVSVGPARLLRPVEHAALWWQVGLPAVIAVATCAAGALLLLASIGRVELRAWRWLALGLVVWSWGSIDAFVRRPPVSEHLWEWSTGIAPLWAVVCFVTGFHRALGLARPRVDAALTALASLVSVAILLLPPVYGFAGTITAGVCAVAVAGYLVVLLVRTPAAGDAERRRRFALPAAIGILLGLHDVVGASSGYTVGMLLSPYIPAVAVLTSAWVLVGRLVDAHREAAALNRDLERRVADKHRELEDNYARLAQLERDRAIAEERARLMRDVHDGVGGQLVSTLALVEGGPASTEAVADSIRAALEDLRLVIDSLDPSEDDLLSVLASVRSRLEPRLARHGLRFAWQVTDLPAVEGFGPDMALQAMRIVQEALTNVVKHARARTVTVRTGESDGERPGVFIEVHDDGRGIAADAPLGRGLTNMARRAARLGGTIDVRSDASGTTVRLWLPRKRAA